MLFFFLQTDTEGKIFVPFPTINLEQIQEAERISQTQSDSKELEKTYLEQLEEIRIRHTTTSSPSVDE